MEKHTLTVTQRSETGKQTKLVRAKGMVPGVIYGREVEPQAISVDALVLARTFHRAGQTGLIELTIDDAKPVHVLISDLQKDYTGAIRHFDLHQVKMDEVVTTEVPIRLIGESSAVFNLGGSLVQVLDGLEVEALPVNLPQNIEVDVSGLTELESHISVADIKLDTKVKVLTDESEMVCRVESPRSEEELAELDAEMGDEVPAEVAAEAEQTTEGDKPAS